MSIVHRHTIRKQLVDYSKPNCFFVTVCTNKNGYYFEQHLELTKIAEQNIKLLSSYFQNISIDNFAIMPNHVHLIIKIKFYIKNVDLGKIIRLFKSKTVVDWLKYIRNNNLNEIASIWQRNYHEHIIRNKSEYKKYFDYTTNNPNNWQNDPYHPRLNKKFFVK